MFLAEAPLSPTPGGSGRDVSVATCLPRASSSVPGARRMVRLRFVGLLTQDALDDLLLVVSELVTNALLYGEGDIQLRLTFDGRRVSGEVMDEGAIPDGRLRGRTPDEFGGRGLLLVSQVTDRWGCQDGTSHVWFELSARREQQVD
jgi:anti-sigma regulatory factor (Ser/Thr protein kinase)